MAQNSGAHFEPPKLVLIHICIPCTFQFGCQMVPIDTTGGKFTIPEGLILESFFKKGVPAQWHDDASA